MSESSSTRENTQAVVELCFDFASPYAYFAHWRAHAVFGDLPIEVRWVPVYLRGFDSFKTGVPFSAAKAAYVIRDLQRTSEYLDVPYAQPAAFPINGLYLLRGAVWLGDRPEAAAYREAGFDAAWGSGRPVSSAEAAADIAAAIGIDRSAFVAGITDAAVKDELKKNTSAAVDRGAFGVPTFFVGDDMYWGQDRMSQVRAKLEDQLRA